MPQYSCKVRSRDGKTSTTLRAADSLAAVKEQLRAAGFAILEITEVPGPRVPADTPAWHPAWLVPVRSVDIELGMRQLSVMLRSGMPLLAALQTMEEQSASPRSSAVWRGVAASIRSGTSFSQALRDASAPFSEEIVQLAEAGEASGELDETLLRASELLEGRRNLRTLVVNALAYPCLAIALAVCVAAYMVGSVIPQIAEFLKDSGAALPGSTRLLLRVADFLSVWWPHIVLGILGGALVWTLVRRTAPGRLAQDTAILRIPVFRGIQRLSITAAFARGMALLTESGVTLTDALDVAAKMLTNRLARSEAESARECVLAGVPLSAALSSAPVFLPMLSRMVAVAETTGDLSGMFLESARFHEQLLAVKIKRFSVVVEPVAIVITALIVGFVYVSFFMALFSMASVR